VAIVHTYGSDELRPNRRNPKINDSDTGPAKHINTTSSPENQNVPRINSAEISNVESDPLEAVQAIVDMYIKPYLKVTMTMCICTPVAKRSMPWESVFLTEQDAKRLDRAHSNTERFIIRARHDPILDASL